jgi:hypothetical protein
MRTGEADYVVVHPRYGILVLEVKGGEISATGRACGPTAFPAAPVNSRSSAALASSRG